LSGAGVAPIVEVGNSIANINWAATYNFTPSSISVSATGKPTQTPVPTGTSSAGTFAGPFTSNTNGDSVTVSIAAVDPVGATHISNQTITFSSKVVWGSTTPPEVVGQALWDALNIDNNVLSPNGTVGTMSFASGPGQDQTFARLASFGPPTLMSGGFTYPPTLLGTSVITENGTTQTYNFYTVGAPGLTFSWSMT
jgi:hypothetical protein